MLYQNTTMSKAMYLCIYLGCNWSLCVWLVQHGSFFYRLKVGFWEKLFQFSPSCKLQNVKEIERVNSKHIRRRTLNSNLIIANNSKTVMQVCSLLAPYNFLRKGKCGKIDPFCYFVVVVHFTSEFLVSYACKIVFYACMLESFIRLYSLHWIKCSRLNKKSNFRHGEQQLRSLWEIYIISDCWNCLA